MNRNVRLDRLNRLVFLLKNHEKLLPEVQFDMRFWCADRSRVLWYDYDNKMPPSCHTAACALGIAYLYKPFRRAGLRYEEGMIKYKGLINIRAGEKFFGITNDESYFLFSLGSYLGKNITVSSVIKRVKKLIGKYSNE